MLNKNNKEFWKERQNFLKKYGYNKSVDGVPGQFTAAAIKKFQTDAKKKGWYIYRIDGDWAEMTEVAYQIATGKKKATVQTVLESNYVYATRVLTDSRMRQDTDWFCALNSIQQLWYDLFGIVVNESEIAKIAGTTTSGTNHVGIEKALNYLAKKYNKKIKIDWFWFKDLGWKKIAEIIQNPKQSLFVHNQYREKFGHYEFVWAINLAKKIVRIPNSLSGGYWESRSFSEFEKYINLKDQKQICKVTAL